MRELTCQEKQKKREGRKEGREGKEKKRSESEGEKPIWVLRR